MLTVLGVWVVVMAAYLVRGQLPDAPLLGVPGAVYLALSPSLFGRRQAATTAEPRDGTP